MNPKIFKTLFIILLILFISSYFIEETGYYDYKLQKKTSLTEEQIKQFEKDVASGNKIDINNYLIDTSKDYTNKFTSNATKTTNTINKYLKKTIEAVFKMINNLVEE